MEILIISGLSGGGKSKAASFLEDMGFYIVDNMPAAMILKFAEFCEGGGGRYDRAALVYDVRTAPSVTEIFGVLDQLRALRVCCRVLFLEASPEVIIQRYKESRRRHPLQRSAGSLEEAVRRERALMEPLKERSDVVIDTSHTSPAQLRARLLREFGGAAQSGMAVNVISFGFKYGLPMEADLVLDVRFLPNPYYVEALRPQSGLDPEVAEYVLRTREAQGYLTRLRELLAYTLPLYEAEGRAALVIAVGCTGGHHRSVAVAHALAEFLGERCGCPVNHRDLARNREEGVV